MDPVQHPKITLGDRTYEVIFRTGDIMRLRKDYGFSLNDVPAIAADPISNSLFLLTMLKVGLTHCAPDLTLDEIAGQLDRTRVKELAEVITTATGKVVAQVNAMLKAPATVQ